jgi:hypothetical protein
MVLVLVLPKQRGTSQAFFQYWYCFQFSKIQSEGLSFLFAEKFQQISVNRFSLSQIFINE